MDISIQVKCRGLRGRGQSFKFLDLGAVQVALGLTKGFANDYAPHGATTLGTNSLYEATTQCEIFQ